MNGFLKDGPAAGQNFEVGDPPISRGIIVLGETPFGEHAHRYYLSAIDGTEAVDSHGGAVPGRPRRGHLSLGVWTSELSKRATGRESRKPTHAVRRAKTVALGRALGPAGVWRGLWR